jgi:hypothetical protein
MNALKAVWTVRAGVISGEEMEKYTKRWHYTSEERAKDDAGANPYDLAYHSTFAKLRAEAVDYYIQVSLPNALNWAELTFIWY